VETTLKELITLSRAPSYIWGKGPWKNGKEIKDKKRERGGNEKEEREGGTGELAPM